MFLDRAWSALVFLVSFSSLLLFHKLVTLFRTPAEGSDLGLYAIPYLGPGMSMFYSSLERSVSVRVNYEV